MEYSFTKTNTEEDYYNFFMDSNKFRKFKSVVCIFLISLFSILLLFNLLYMFKYKKDTYIMDIIPCIFCLYVLLVFNKRSKNRARINAKKFYELNKDIIPEKLITFYTDRINLKDDLYEINVPIKNWNSFWITNESVYLIRFSINFYRITKSDFESDEKFYEFCQFVKDNYGKKVKICIGK